MRAPLDSDAESATRVSVRGRPTRYRFVVLLLIFLTYMIAGADRANIGVVVPFVKKELLLSNTDIGLMTGLFYLAYSAIQVPAGMLIERFGTRGVFSIALIATSLATFVMGLVSSAFQMKAARVVLGLAEGPLNIGCVSTIGRWFPPAERGRAIGVFIAAVKFAPAMVPPVCAVIILQFGWRAVFYSFALPGLLLAVWWFLRVPDRPEDSPFTNELEREHIAAAQERVAAKRSSSSGQTIIGFIDHVIRARSVRPIASRAGVLRSFNVWACGLGYGLLVGIAYTIMTWIPTYLVEVKKLAVMQMGLLASTPWIGAIVGNLLGGFLSDRVFAQRRKPVMLITSASTIASMYSLIYASGSAIGLATLFFVVGILLNLGYSTFLVYPMQLVEDRLIPFAASIVNTIGAICGAVAPTVVGMILDRYDWDRVFLFLACCSLATLVLVVAMIEPLDEGQMSPQA